MDCVKSGYNNSNNNSNSNSNSNNNSNSNSSNSNSNSNNNSSNNNSCDLFSEGLFSALPASTSTYLTGVVRPCSTNFQGSVYRARLNARQDPY